jgi:hypothetical protein
MNHDLKLYDRLPRQNLLILLRWRKKKYINVFPEHRYLASFSLLIIILPYLVRHILTEACPG